MRTYPLPHHYRLLRHWIHVLATGSLLVSACVEQATPRSALPAAVKVEASLAGRTSPNLKVAFIGDQDANANAIAVLQLIANEGAHAVLHQGDFDYSDDPDLWDANITAVLGEDFPYFASVGNHDDSKFYGPGGYQDKLLQRLARMTGASCTGNLGVNSACTYQGLFFILSGAGTLGSGHEAYIREQLAADSSIWRVCSWHKNQNAMQVGQKGDEVGWGPYEACRELGAIVATGHEHSYERTKTLVSTELQTVDPDWPARDVLRMAPGATFVFVSGLGGYSIRNQDRCLPTTYPYGCNGEWAKIHTSDQNAQFGALFIEFHVHGIPTEARGYFKNVNGEIVDQFTITSQMVPPDSSVSPSLSTLTAVPPLLEASNGSSVSTITVTANDTAGNPVSGATVVLAATGAGNTLTQPVGPTDSNGVAAGTLFSTVAEEKTISATISGVTIHDQATINVGVGPFSPNAPTVRADPD